jgi:hypothetical protein
MADDGFALTFDANGTMLRVSGVETVLVAPYTVLGWQVGDIDAKANERDFSGIFVQGTERDKIASNNRIRAADDRPAPPAIRLHCCKTRQYGR